MREHEVPTHVQAEDRVLLWFSFPQIVAIIAVCALSYGAYSLCSGGTYGSADRAGSRPLHRRKRHDRGEGRGQKPCRWWPQTCLRYRLGSRRYAGPRFRVDAQLSRRPSPKALPTPWRCWPAAPGAALAGCGLWRGAGWQSMRRNRGRRPFRPHGRFGKGRRPVTGGGRIGRAHGRPGQGTEGQVGEDPRSRLSRGSVRRQCGHWMSHRPLSSGVSKISPNCRRWRRTRRATRWKRTLSPSRPASREQPYPSRPNKRSGRRRRRRKNRRSRARRSGQNSFCRSFW